MPIPVLTTLAEALGLDPMDIAGELLFPNKAEGEQKLIEQPGQSPESVLPILAAAGIKQSGADVRYKQAIERIDEAVRTARFDKKGMKEYVKQIARNFNVDEGDLAKVAKEFEKNIDLGDSLLLAADKPRVLEAGMEKVSKKRGSKVFKDIAKKVESEMATDAARAVPVGEAFTPNASVVKRGSSEAVGQTKDLAANMERGWTAKPEVHGPPKGQKKVGTSFNPKDAIEAEFRNIENVRDVVKVGTPDEVAKVIKEGVESGKSVNAIIDMIPGWAKRHPIATGIGALILSAAAYLGTRDKVAQPQDEYDTQFELVPIEKNPRAKNEFRQIEKKLNEAYKDFKKSGRR